METTNPIVMEVASRATDLLLPERLDENLAGVGGTELVTEVLNHTTMACARMFPMLALEAAGLQASVASGIALGIILAQRGRESDELMRSLGME